MGKTRNERSRKEGTFLEGVEAALASLVDDVQIIKASLSELTASTFDNQYFDEHWHDWTQCNNIPDSQSSWNVLAKEFIPQSGDETFISREGLLKLRSSQHGQSDLGIKVMTTASVSVPDPVTSIILTLPGVVNVPVNVSSSWEPLHPWIFLDRQELGRVSATCSRSLELVDSWTPFGAFTSTVQPHTSAEDDCAGSVSGDEWDDFHNCPTNHLPLPEDAVESAQVEQSIPSEEHVMFTAEQMRGMVDYTVDQLRAAPCWNMSNDSLAKLVSDSKADSIPMTIHTSSQSLTCSSSWRQWAGGVES
jgi:hypothetical protein